MITCNVENNPILKDEEIFYTIKHDSKKEMETSEYEQYKYDTNKGFLIQHYDHDEEHV